nr:tyrosine-type recombinase/integrase [Aquisalimonas sp. 2447]
MDSKLRGCDLVSLQVRDVIHRTQAVKRAAAIQKKTDRPVQFELTPQTRQAAEKWVSKAHLQPGDYLFPNRVHASPHISSQQYARILKSWVAELGLDPAEYGIHSLRRAKATLVCRRSRDVGTNRSLDGPSSPGRVHGRARSTQTGQPSGQVE